MIFLKFTLNREGREPFHIIPMIYKFTNKYGVLLTQNLRMFIRLSINKQQTLPINLCLPKNKKPIQVLLIVHLYIKNKKIKMEKNNN